MKTIKTLLAGILVLGSISVACETSGSAEKETASIAPDSGTVTNGTLFIIGGGKRPPSLVQKLIELSELNKAESYAIILPMSSEEPDSAIYYAKKQFTDLGVPDNKVKGYHFTRRRQPKSWLDSLQNAPLVYISGGDQNRFMDAVRNTPVFEAIHTAYQNGGVIAGTSAGAAVMSAKMITGNELKYPEYTGEFRTIEANNIEIAEGLGLTNDLIVDQHFIWRMRMNRLISVVLEHPEQLAVGIDESTALIVKGNDLQAVGESQVITLRHNKSSTAEANGLLGGRDIQLNVLLPGDTITLSSEIQ